MFGQAQTSGHHIHFARIQHIETGVHVVVHHHFKLQAVGVAKSLQHLVRETRRMAVVHIVINLAAIRHRNQCTSLINVLKSRQCVFRLLRFFDYHLHLFFLGLIFQVFFWILSVLTREKETEGHNNP